ncbi:MAG: Uma2 family endonuclease, partial [Promicromonosporaceae bacterium]|nr:Uma2 family endonuclease [Promicromonosporaceae bacterium]
SLEYAPMSEEQYLALPEQPKAEWVNGMAILMPPAAWPHNYILLNIAIALANQLPEAIVLPDSGLRMYKTSRSYRVPDIMVSDHPPTDRVWIDDPPVAVVEVLSPGTITNDLLFKSVEYANLGIQQYWVAHPDTRVVSVFGNKGDTWDENAIVVVDEHNPEAELTVGDLGTVKLVRDQIFGVSPQEALQ